MLFQNPMLLKGKVLGSANKVQTFQVQTWVFVFRLLLIGILLEAGLGSPLAYGGIHTWVDGRFYVDPTHQETSQTLTPMIESLTEDNSHQPTVIYGDVVVNFYKDDLPFGSQIEIIYGLGGTETNDQGEAGPISWERSGSVDAQAIGPYVWSAHIASPLTQREGPRKYSKLQFCVRITLPNGTSYHAERCHPPTLQLEALIPWETSPHVGKQYANWRRLNLNHTYLPPES
jgi:hypothetical protein